MEGRIIRLLSNDYTVFKEGQIYLCKCRGKFRNLHIHPLVGDLVSFDPNQGMIEEVKPRKNELLRPPIANIDQAVIVTSFKEPDFSSMLLDRQLVLIEYEKVKPILCFTKLDLLNKEQLKELNDIEEAYQKIGYEVYETNHLDLLKPIFTDRITVFTGQSGAGKSTLLNRLDPTFTLKTDEISKALGRGKHTTRHTELYPYQNGWIADTPGFSSILVSSLKRDVIKDQFPEFIRYQSQCEYQDCMHEKEQHCAIKEMVEQGQILKSRYNNYLKMIERG